MGKSGGTTVQTAQLTPEQRAQIQAQTDFFTQTLKPTYEKAVGGATNLYNQTAGGVNYAAQNLAGQAQQAQQTLGSTGESALRTGIGGLENLYSPEYEQQQLAAVLNPAQAQYQQNLAAQTNAFGGAGQIGSARNALAQTQLAGMNQMNQQAAAAQVENQIAQQRAAAAGQLIGAGQGGIGQALGAAGQQVTAAMTPQQLYNQYASVIFGTPASSYSPDFRGTQGTTQTATKASMGINI
jgi:hypothetical protein